MPPAVALAIPAIAGAGASAAGGKKQSSAANKAANQQFQMQQQLFNTGMRAWQPAQSYWSSILSGDPTAVAQATGPYADIARGQGAASSRQIAATAPSGGEANLAQTENQLGTYNQIARLSAGMQPQAATALGQLAGVPMQISAPNAGSGLKYNTHQQEMTGANKGALGQGLGQVAAGSKGRSGGKGGNRPAGGTTNKPGAGDF